MVLAIIADNFQISIIWWHDENWSYIVVSINGPGRYLRRDKNYTWLPAIYDVNEWDQKGVEKVIRTVEKE